MALHGNNMNTTSNHDQLKQKRLAEVREKIDRGLKQLDEGRAISAEDARSVPQDLQ
jgi:hypothetical protein